MIRTCGPRFRKPVLYPTELRGLRMSDIIPQIIPQMWYSYPGRAVVCTIACLCCFDNSVEQGPIMVDNFITGVPMQRIPV